MNAPAHAPIYTPSDANRSIGAILVDVGRLSVNDAESILRLQREKDIRFGDAAKELKLLTEDDICFALARQFDYPYLLTQESQVSTEVIAAYAPFSAAVEALRAVRSQLMLRWFDSDADSISSADPSPERKALAIVSPERGEGRSWMAANLAVVFSQLGERTLLIDGDLRHPRQHDLFGIPNRAGLSSVLSGRNGLDVIQRVPALLDLSVLTAGTVPPNPQELLSRLSFSQLLAQASEVFDVILIDTPSAAGSADAQTIAVRASGALIVARKHFSRTTRLEATAAALRAAGSVVVGSVVNDS